MVDPDPYAFEPVPPAHVVGADYTETWIEVMDAYHNPSATHPFDPELLPGAAHHKLLADGLVESTSPVWNPLQTRTSIFRLFDERTVDGCRTVTPIPTWSRPSILLSSFTEKCCPIGNLPQLHRFGTCMFAVYNVRSMASANASNGPSVACSASPRTNAVSRPFISSGVSGLHSNGSAPRDQIG